VTNTGRHGAEESFASVAEHAPAMLWRGDERGKCVYLNRAQREFWGVADDGIGSFDWSSTLLPEDAEKVFGPFSEGMAKQQPFVCEARYRRADGEIRILRTQAEPRFDASGAFTGMIGVNLDVTDERKAQTELAESEARLRLLMREMSHRIKNNLSTVLSIAAQTGRRASSYEEFNKSFQARLQALAKSHDLLLRGAGDTADLRALLEAELRPYSEDASGRTLTLDGEPVLLEGKAATSFALVVHELATNAAKYGAYSAGGALVLSWRRMPDHLIRLEWRERGGPPAQVPTRSGFGSQLVRSLLSSDLGGDIETRFPASGFEADLVFRTRPADA
jgi:PAS domain S-box-containing protein